MIPHCSECLLTSLCIHPCPEMIDSNLKIYETTPTFPSSALKILCQVIRLTKTQDFIIEAYLYFNHNPTYRVPHTDNNSNFYLKNILIKNGQYKEVKIKGLKSSNKLWYFGYVNEDVRLIIVCNEDNGPQYVLTKYFNIR